MYLFPLVVLFALRSFTPFGTIITNQATTCVKNYYANIPLLEKVRPEFLSHICFSLLILQKKPDWSKKGDEKKVKEEEVEA